MDTVNVYQLRVDVPLFVKGRKFHMHTLTGRVFGTEHDGTAMEFPLRPGLAGYLWLLRTEPLQMKFVESYEVDL